MIRAREVLADCEQALADFKAAGPAPCWRTRWTGMVALLRAVGYVLKDVDAKQDTDLKKANDDAWKDLNESKPEPLIFHKFICEERHNVVHLYRIGARLNTKIVPGTGRLSFSGESQQGLSSSTTYDSSMLSGAFCGRDAIEVCREAIAFWKDYLDKVEAAAQAKEWIQPSAPVKTSTPRLVHHN